MTIITIIIKTCFKTKIRFTWIEILKRSVELGLAFIRTLDWTHVTLYAALGLLAAEESFISVYTKSFNQSISKLCVSVDFWVQGIVPISIPVQSIDSFACWENNVKWKEILNRKIFDRLRLENTEYCILPKTHDSLAKVFWIFFIFYFVCFLFLVEKKVRDQTQ